MRAAWRIGADDYVDRVGGGLEIPVVFLANQDNPGTGPTLVAVIGSSAVEVIKPETVLAAAQGARAMPIAQELGVDPEARQDLRPSAAGALDRAHAAPRFCFAFE